MLFPGWVRNEKKDELLRTADGMLKEMRANARKTAVEKFDFHSYGNRIINFLSKE